MSQKKTKSKNPYDFIRGVELFSRNNNSLRLAIIGSEFKYENKLLVATKFRVTKVLMNAKKSDEDIVNLFNKIDKFCSICNNKLECITMMVDAYKANSDILNISFKTIPRYSDAKDGRFVWKEIIDEG